MTHTPTPWQTDERDFWAMETPRFSRMPIEQKRKNNRRIRACVNFFHGQDIPTERIEEGGFWDLIGTLMVARGMILIEARAHRERGEPSKAEPNEGLAQSIADKLTKLGIE